MGSCMSSNSGDGGVASQTQQRKSKSKTKAFKGQVSNLILRRHTGWHLSTLSIWCVWSELIFGTYYISFSFDGDAFDCCSGLSKFDNVWYTQGNRLGSANDPSPYYTAANSGAKKSKVDLPAKRVDPSLSESERDRQREARLAAAEKRQKASGVSTKKKKQNQSQPLRGPNTEPLMRWTAWDINVHTFVKTKEANGVYSEDGMINFGEKGIWARQCFLNAGTSVFGSNWRRIKETETSSIYEVSGGAWLRTRDEFHEVLWITKEILSKEYQAKIETKIYAIGNRCSKLMGKKSIVSIIFCWCHWNVMPQINENIWNHE